MEIFQKHKALIVAFIISLISLATLKAGYPAIATFVLAITSVRLGDALDDTRKVEP